MSDLSELSQLPLSATNDGAYVVVPHTSSGHDIPSTPDPMPQPIAVTDMWVERCLHRKELVSPQANVTSTPFRQFPISGITDIRFFHMAALITARIQKYDYMFYRFRRGGPATHVESGKSYGYVNALLWMMKKLTRLRRNLR